MISLMTCWCKTIHSAAVIGTTFFLTTCSPKRSVTASLQQLRFVGSFQKNRSRNSSDTSFHLYPISNFQISSSSSSSTNKSNSNMVRRSPRLNPLGIATRSSLFNNSHDGESLLGNNGDASNVNKRSSKAAGRTRKSSSTTPSSSSSSTSSTSKNQRSKRTRVSVSTTPTKATKDISTSKSKKKGSDKIDTYLPRTRESAIQDENSSSSTNSGSMRVMGIDEAGRGPLAGPVVAAAAIIPTNIPGITDSKKITKEEERERLYEQIIASADAQWAICVVDAPRIDEINILQATLQAMRMAACGIISTPPLFKEGGERAEEASVQVKGCYIVCGQNDSRGETIAFDNDGETKIISDLQDPLVTSNYYALIDGNRLPKEMPCEAETMVKGDSREYSIAAASILAKVTRDRLMHEYDSLYPQYELARHKGYPTAVHMKKVHEFGASPIHRRTFAPLKHMTLDEDGNVLSEN